MSEVTFRAEHSRRYYPRRGDWSIEPPPYLQGIVEREFVRMNERWLSGVMKAAHLNHSVKVIAYFLADHLNWATMDCWPSHRVLARLVAASDKTIQRAIGTLEEKGVLSVWRLTGSRQPLRYAPVYNAFGDTVVPAVGHLWSGAADKDVQESCLKTLQKPALPASEQNGSRRVARPSFLSAHRGRLEVEIAPLIGGLEALARLSSVNDGIIDRLCEAQHRSSLDSRLIQAARLAANQVRGVWQ